MSKNDISEKKQQLTKNFLYKKWLNLRSEYYRKMIYYRYACDIHPECELNNVFFRHPIGVVIGKGVKLENNVVILQNTTFGSLKFDENGFGLPCNQIIGERSIICCGAKILGDVKIGKNCIIGANAIVTIDIPDDSTVIGVNQIIKTKNK